MKVKWQNVSTISQSKILILYEPGEGIVEQITRIVGKPSSEYNGKYTWTVMKTHTQKQLEELLKECQLA